MFHCLPYEPEPYDIQNTININSGNSDISHCSSNIPTCDISNTLFCSIQDNISQGLNASYDTYDDECEDTKQETTQDTNCTS